MDVTAQVGAYWADFFTQLELQHSLNNINVHHIWLLQHIFLHVINQQLSFFAEAWNQHKLKIQDGPNHSPADMFGFDMIVHGVQRYQLPEDELDEEELEVYGVDWEGLYDDQLLQSQKENNSADEGWSSWVGQQGPPAHLNEVSVDPPTHNLTPDDASRVYLWVQGLGCARAM